MYKASLRGLPDERIGWCRQARRLAIRTVRGKVDHYFAVSFAAKPQLLLKIEPLALQSHRLVLLAKLILLDLPLN
jgi:hypothetical protein